MRIVLKRKQFGLLNAFGAFGKAGNFAKASKAIKAGEYAAAGEQVVKGVGKAAGLGLGVTAVGAGIAGGVAANRTKNVLEGNMGGKSFSEQRSYALMADGSGKSIMDFKNDWTAGGGKEKLGDFKSWYTGQNTGKAAANQNIMKQQAAQRARRGAAVMKNQKAGYNLGYQSGQKSVGALGGIKNTWAKAGKLGKAGMITGGLAAGGLMLKGASSFFGGNNQKQTEQ